MPLAIIIMVIGAAGAGWVFLKARQLEGKNTLKKVKQGSKTVKKAAAHMAKQPSGEEVYQAPASMEPVGISRSRVDVAAKAQVREDLPGGMTLAGWRELHPTIPTYEEYKIDNPKYIASRRTYYASHGIYLN